MTDIVERLRMGWPNNLEITDEAADEIERLQGELDKAHRLLSQSIGWQRDAEIVKGKQAQEIEHLRSRLAVLESSLLKLRELMDE